jgi:hypothetical protein
VGTWLSPEAREVAVPGLPPGAAAELVYQRLNDLAAELADWFAFQYPESWRNSDDPEAELDRKLEFVRRAARLWRRRGTPAGFFAWLCFWFELEAPATKRPLMIEHFKYRTTDPGGTAGEADDAAHRVTLLVPLITPFMDYRRRRELMQFVARNAPAHLQVRICWIAEGDPRYTGFDPTQTAAVQTLLSTIATYTSKDDGIHLETSPPSGSPLNRLGQGNLPGPAHQ